MAGSSSSSPSRRLKPLQAQQSGWSTSTVLVVMSLTALLMSSYYSLRTTLPEASNIFSRPYNFSQLGEPKTYSDGSRSFKIAVITDLDHDSKIPDAKNKWRSLMKYGTLKIDVMAKKASVQWDDEVVSIHSQIAAGGRSMELSDLAVFDGNLLTIDDRTGIIYKIVGKDAVPWVLLNDGPGNVTKGFKGEWMAVKNHQLYVGGLGKEWTTTEGVFVNHHPMYVKVVSHNGCVEHVRWVDEYIKLRTSYGIPHPGPGYMIHESAQFSELHKKWFFMPRRASHEKYTEAEDEHRGTNVLLVADEDFSNVEVRHVGEKGDGARGFSAFQFVPGSKDDLIVALKSEEKDGVPQASYITVFSVSSGRILLNESQLDGKFKYEGIAFV
ncbi:hypothetical protein QR680_017144 [Steinernema hermaphroditum]|uniref:Soluble calcium-activated nucleotidase 1 n=1 Tax=Steinernema hermaphroditum TaxID=289476 RepID=A0AA39HEG8_9BILA|nr:hypothetical protein QR680_017144 [Steinernema hermaphroditum]